MSNLLITCLKFLAIAFAAAVVAWLPVYLLFGLDMSSRLQPSFAGGLFQIALAGSFGIGLPIALATFMMARRHLASSPSTLVLIVLLVGVMIALTSLVLLDASAAFLFGIPSLLAAATYAVLGWLWVLRPMRVSAEHEA